ncbi:hypothetical protein TNCV_2056491 [Trichonephila clavipes]|nr:hypothetical protein TNCV_2056491 [Trichonephila clavipes]
MLPSGCCIYGGQQCTKIFQTPNRPLADTSQAETRGWTGWRVERVEVIEAKSDKIFTTSVLRTIVYSRDGSRVRQTGPMSGRQIVGVALGPDKPDPCRGGI